MSLPSFGRVRSRILLVESDAWDAGLVQEAIDELEEQRYRTILPWQMDLYHAESLAEALTALDQNTFEVILLTLDLSDSKALHTFLRVRQKASACAIVVLSYLADEHTALAAVREGAFAYLLKEELDCFPLARTLRSALERQQAIVARAELPLLDELTSLISRDGFVLLGEQSLQLAARWERPATLFLIELTAFSLLEDVYGHQAHDLALIETGHLLRNVFAQSDVVARLQGNTFGALCFDSLDQIEPVEQRIERHFAGTAAGPAPRAPLSYVTGNSTLHPTASTNLDILLLDAQRSLQASKERQHALALG